MEQVKRNYNRAMQSEREMAKRIRRIRLGLLSVEQSMTSNVNAQFVERSSILSGQY